MAINISILSNGNSASKSITFDFAGDVLAGHSGFISTNAASSSFYFKVSSGARFIDGSSQGKQFPVAKTMRDLSNLALNGVKQSATNTSAPYTDIHSMIVDYTYDYVYGHTANQFSSGVSAQGPMKFS